MSVETPRPDKIRYGSKEIEFGVTRRDRKTLAISVHPDKSVWVVAPFDASSEAIREKVLKRADWIIRQQIDFQAMGKPVVERRFIAGETHWYLGKQYRLKFVSGDEKRISLQNRYFLVEGTRDAGQVKALLDAWYLSHASERFQGYIGEWWTKLGGTSSSVPSATIRKLEKRWGSCTAKGQLILNIDLVKYPSPCVQYVIVHELCHLFEHNHGPKFLALLDKHMPDWRKRKTRLERFEF